LSPLRKLAYIITYELPPHEMSHDNTDEFRNEKLVHFHDIMTSYVYIHRNSRVKLRMHYSQLHVS